MHREWQRLASAQKLETTIHHGKVDVQWDLPHFINYVATQKELMEFMHFPMIDGEQLFVIISRSDGFPCGSRPWVPIAISFANHMEKARTLQYNWTLDVALASEHHDEAMRRTASGDSSSQRPGHNSLGGQGVLPRRWSVFREGLRG